MRRYCCWGLALVLALLLDARRTPAKRFFRLTFFLPYAIPGVIEHGLFFGMAKAAIIGSAAGIRILGEL